MNYEITKSNKGYDDIPSEIIQNVLQHLGSIGDLVSCALVCKRWSYLALEILWYKPNFSTSVLLSINWLSFFTITQATHQTTFHYASFIRRINLSPLSTLIEDLHVMALSSCTRLERLTLAGCSKLTDLGLCTLLHSVGSELISIDLSNVDQITDATILEAAVSCPNLQGLNLYMSRPQTDITDKSIVTLAESCLNLKRIKLNNCTRISEQSAVCLSVYCPRLVEVDFMNCSINDSALKSIFNHCRDLRELRASQVDIIPTVITDNAFLGSPLRLARYFVQLRLVDFTGIATITDMSINILINAAPKIRSLVLNKCSGITDEGILSICQLGKFLHFLHLGHCSQITDVSVQRLTMSCNRIRYLDMACCTEITDRSVHDLSRNLSKLKRIGLVKCAKITDFGLSAFINSVRICSSLERIHLSYCTQLSVLAIAKLLDVCYKLNHLSLTHVPSFLRSDLQQFCRLPPKELTEIQRRAFCVYSGQGVQDLRDYLNTIYNTERDETSFWIPTRPTPTNTGDIGMMTTTTISDIVEEDRTR